MSKQTNTDTGSPANTHPKDGTGIPTVINDENSAADNRLTEEYTRDDNDIAEGVREMHPNRNENKDNATGIGGYRG